MARIGFEGLRKFALFTAFSALALFAAPTETDSALAEGLPKADAASGPEFAGRKAGLIVLEGDVDQAMAAYAARAIGKALESSPDLLVFEINTYGGRLDAAFDISDTMLAVKIPTVALVDKKAISAGALISLSARKLYMRPSTTIGDCAPILQGNEGPVMLGEKIQSPLRARFRAFAEKHGYPSLLAQAMVSEELEVVELTRGDSSRLLLSTALEELPEKETEGWSRRTLVQKGELLTLTDKEAGRFGFSSGTVENVPKLMEALGVSSYESVELDWTEHLARFLATIAPLLMLIGFGALYMEFHTPGFGVFGIVGIAALLLVFFGQSVVGLADHLALGLLVLGGALVLLEIFVLPGTWIAGGIGVVLMAAAMALTVGEPTPSLPDEAAPAVDFARILRNISYVSLLAALALLFPLVFGRFIVKRIPDSVGIALGTTMEGANSPVVSGLPAPGEEGTVLSHLRPVGRVRFGDRAFEAISEADFVDPGRRVRVVSVSENKIIVVPVEEEQ